MIGECTHTTCDCVCVEYGILYCIQYCTACVACNCIHVGENVLHMAIVNEDPMMVKFLLDRGADVHQRCCGKFFTPHDQQSSRRESDQHEWFDVPVNTNYKG